MILTLADFDKFYSLLTSKDLAGDITDDNPVDMFDVCKHDLSCNRTMVLMPSDETAFTLHAINSILYEAHLITTNKEKNDVLINTLMACEWAKSHTGVKQLISNIPIDCETTLAYSKAIGMNMIGIIKDGFLKNGKTVDVVIMGESLDDMIRRLSWLRQ